MTPLARTLCLVWPAPSLSPAELVGPASAVRPQQPRQPSSLPPLVVFWCTFLLLGPLGVAVALLAQPRHYRHD